jgi:hypothetical protein
VDECARCCRRQQREGRDKRPSRSIAGVATFTRLQDAERGAPSPRDQQDHGALSFADGMIRVAPLSEGLGSRMGVRACFRAGGTTRPGPSGARILPRERTTRKMSEPVA